MIVFPSFLLFFSIEKDERVKCKRKPLLFFFLLLELQVHRTDRALEMST